MANPSSGSKRPNPVSQDPEHNKRSRSDRDSRDWKDAHLAGSSRRRRSQDRRSSYRPDYSDRARDHDRGGRHHSRDRGRNRRDEKDGERDRVRERSREDRDRHYPSRDHDGRAHRRDDDRRRARNSPRPTVPTQSAPVNKDHDSEREEGEISPHSQKHQTPPTETRPLHTKTHVPPVKRAAPVPEPELELELSISPVPVEVSLAARRAKRQEILAKYTGVTSVTASHASPSPGMTSAVLPPTTPRSVQSNLPSQLHSTTGSPAPLGTQVAVSQQINGQRSKSTSPTDGMFELAKDNEQEDIHVVAYSQAQRDGDQMISAADYDPSLDRREDEERRVRGTQNETRDVTVTVEEEIEEDEEDLDDMFAINTTKKKKKTVREITVTKPAAPALITTTLDGASDHEGYYQIILGEQLDGGRYQVFASLGKGMFANVVRARVLQGSDGELGKEVAIKIIRSQESMYKAGQKEIQILNKLRQTDPDDKKHVVRLERSFEHRGHLCLVFESLSMNLRDVVKRFGKDVGLNIRAVRAYAQQLFLALSLLRKCNIMHADIKPDNILVNEQKTLLKLCDLGSASDAAENEITPYLVSRFYRAPEIILGYPYDPSLDIWSVGCTLYELYTGKILLPGRSNNQMLLYMMELKGRFNSRMIKKAKFGANYFDDMGNFDSIEKDRVTGADTIKKVHAPSKASRDLRMRLLPSSSTQLKGDEHKLLTSFVDLLDRCLALDPARRITPKEALLHSFIRG